MTEKEYREMIYKKASKVKSKKELNDLIDEITEYGHDYGTVVYGCYAAMKAAFNVIDGSDNGGITGFQAGFIGWEAVEDFMSIKPPAKIVNYRNMLYPQYADKFNKVISTGTWEMLQKEATEHLAKTSKGADRVVRHWKSIVDGVVPFGYTVADK